MKYNTRKSRLEQSYRNIKLEATKVEPSYGKVKNTAKSLHNYMLKTKFTDFAAIRQQLPPIGCRSGPTGFEFLCTNSYTGRMLLTKIEIRHLAVNNAI